MNKSNDAKQKAASLQPKGLVLSPEDKQRLRRTMKNDVAPLWKEIMAARERQKMH